MSRPLRVLSGSRPLSRGLGDAGLRHFFRDAGECRFVRFVPRFPYASHVYLLIVRGSSSYSSPKHHNRSGEDACLLHYAHMTVQSMTNPRILAGWHRPLFFWVSNLDLTCVWYQTDARNTPGYKGCASSCPSGSGGEAHDVLPASFAKRSQPPADVAARNLSA